MKNVPNLVYAVYSDKISSSDQKPYVIQFNATDEEAQIITFD